MANLRMIGPQTSPLQICKEIFSLFITKQMPYKMFKIRNKDLYKVVNSKTGKVHSAGTTKDKAKAQLRLLETIERKMSF